MSKKFLFSTGYEVELSADVVSETNVIKRSFNISRIKSVFVKKPKLIFSGYIAINDEYIEIKKKDMFNVQELLDCLRQLGVVVCYYKGGCTDAYIESSVCVGGCCAFFEIVGADIVYYTIDGNIIKIDIDSVKSLWVTKGYMTFSDDDTIKSVSSVKVGSEQYTLNMCYKKKYFKEAIAFAKKLESFGLNINIF